jgi:nucleotide-binding universal stress UspA family protein
MLFHGLRSNCKKISASAREFTIDVVTEIAHGDPEKEIERRANQDSVDLIVVGHRDISRVRRLLEGSTTDALVRSSPASVLVVHGE